jgi:hypothetical protein
VPDWVAEYVTRQASSEGKTVSEIIGRMLQEAIPDTEKPGEQSGRAGGPESVRSSAHEGRSPLSIDPTCAMAPRRSP